MRRRHLREMPGCEYERIAGGTQINFFLPSLPLNLYLVLINLRLGLLCPMNYAKAFRRAFVIQFSVKLKGPRLPLRLRNLK